MRPTSPARSTFFVPAIVCLALALVAVVQLNHSLGGDAYWTSAERPLSLAQTRDRVAIEIRGEPMDELLRKRALLENDGTPVRDQEVRVRLNEADRVSRTQSMLLAGALGAACAFLLSGLMVGKRTPSQP